jgi:multidrug efflux system membrane fusion protein
MDAEPAGHRRPSRRLIAALAFAAALGGALVVFGPFGHESSSSQPAPGAKQPRQPVIAAPVVVKPMPVEFATVGRVQAIRSVAVKPRITGVIAAVDAAEGQDVAVGAPLFKLDDREYLTQLRQAEAALARNQAELDSARRDLKRTTALVEKNVSARSTLDTQKAQVDALQAAVREAEATIERAKVQHSYTDIRAPIAGRLGTIRVTLGSSVNASDAAALVTINQLKPVYVAFTVPQHYLAELQDAIARGSVPVTASLPGNAEARFAGTVAFIENAIDAATNGLPVKATFENADLRQWPGQFVTLALTLRTEPNAIVLPAEALQADQSGDFVFVVKDDQTVDTRAVAVRWISGNEVVVAGTLKAGEQVVTRGQLRLQRGTPVDVREPATEAQEAGAS